MRWDRAEDFTIYSGDERWIDFTSSIFVANVGHGNPHVIAAVEKRPFGLPHALEHIERRIHIAIRQIDPSDCQVRRQIGNRSGSGGGKNTLLEAGGTLT